MSHSSNQSLILLTVQKSQKERCYPRTFVGLSIGSSCLTIQWIIEIGRADSVVDEREHHYIDEVTYFMWNDDYCAN